MTDVRTAPPTVAVDDRWRRLDPRMLAVHPTLDLARLVPVLVVVLVGGGRADDGWRLGLSTALALLVLAGGVLRWATTTYRIGPERVEVRTGLLRRRHRSVHRDRIRTADLTSSLVHRLFGLAVVRVGTGSHEGGGDAEVKLDAVAHAAAEDLRGLLLRTSPASPARDHAAPPDVARLDWRWVRYAPLTFSSLAVLGAVWAGLLRVLDETGWGPRDVARLRFVAGAPWAWAVGALVVVAVGGACVAFLLGWWGYRLTRGDDGGLVVRRGLFTRRSLTLEGSRIRGVELDEPLLLRLGRAARPVALTSGLRADRDGSGSAGAVHVGSLAPAVPRAEAHRILGEALGTASPMTAALTRHPTAARRRRYVRAVGPLLAVAVVVSLLPWGVPWWAAVPVALVLGGALGAARWAALGHALTGDHLVVRQGALVRRTVVLRRSGVIGWRLHQSPFQRAGGLVTLVAVSAAGHGRYEVPDVGVGRALALVDATTPGLLDEFGSSGVTVSGRSGALTVRRCG